MRLASLPDIDLNSVDPAAPDAKHLGRRAAAMAHLDNSPATQSATLSA